MNNTIILYILTNAIVYYVQVKSACCFLSLSFYLVSLCDVMTAQLATRNKFLTLAIDTELGRQPPFEFDANFFSFDQQHCRIRQLRLIMVTGQYYKNKHLSKWVYILTIDSADQWIIAITATDKVFQARFDQCGR